MIFAEANKKSKRQVLNLFGINEKDVEKPLNELNLLNDEKLLEASSIIQTGSEPKDISTLLKRSSR